MRYERRDTNGAIRTVRYQLPAEEAGFRMAPGARTPAPDQSTVTTVWHPRRVQVWSKLHTLDCIVRSQTRQLCSILDSFFRLEVQSFYEGRLRCRQGAENASPIDCASEEHNALFLRPSHSVAIPWCRAKPARVRTGRHARPTS